MKRFLILILLYLYHISILANGGVFSEGVQQETKHWVDSVFSTLDLRAKVAQLLMSRVNTRQELDSLLTLANPPGFIIGDISLFKNRLHNLNSGLPTLGVTDLRLGFEMGDNLLPFPDQVSLAVMDSVNKNHMIDALVLNVDSLYSSLFLWSKKNCPFNTSKSLSREDCGYCIWDASGSASNFSYDASTIFACDMPNKIFSPFPSYLPRICIEDRITSLGTGLSVAMDEALPHSYLSVEQALKDKRLLISNNYDRDLERLLTAFEYGGLDIQLLNNTCKLVLEFKYKVYKNKFRKSEIKNVNELKVKIREAYENSVSIFQPPFKDLLPIENMDLNVGFYNLGCRYLYNFKKLVNNYIQESLNELSSENYDLVFILADENLDREISFERELLELRKIYSNADFVFVWGGNPSFLPFKKWPSELDAMVASPSNIDFSWEVMAQSVFNGIPTTNKNLELVYGKQLSVYQKSFKATRLKYGIAEQVGLNADTLLLIEDIISEAIELEAMPGAQLLIARNGVVVVNKSYGWHTYKKERLVENSDLYDLASLTKIIATMPIVLSTYDKGKWFLNDRLGKFLPEADTTDKRNITIRDLLLHESGLPSYIPFYLETIDNSKMNGELFSWRKSASHSLKMDENLYVNDSITFREDVYHQKFDSQYSVPVAKNMYLNHNYLDSIYYKILNVKIHKRGYVYSDLNFILLQRILENLINKSIDSAVYNEFYRPLGAKSLMFNPWVYDIDNVVPTENDLIFRRQLLKGYVHDQTAAMMGGVAGNAGLFGNANDIAKLMQMMLNKGVYGWRRFINNGTVNFFTSKQNEKNRRGLGFDKAEINIEKESPVSRMASELSYGHSGFTGTIVWVDPAYDLIYIFLSNRIHPYQYNRLLIERNVRTNIQDIIYRAIEK